MRNLQTVTCIFAHVRSEPLPISAWQPAPAGPLWPYRGWPHKGYPVVHCNTASSIALEHDDPFWDEVRVAPPLTPPYYM